MLHENELMGKNDPLVKSLLIIYTVSYIDKKRGIIMRSHATFDERPSICATVAPHCCNPFTAGCGKLLLGTGLFLRCHAPLPLAVFAAAPLCAATYVTHLHSSSLPAAGFYTEAHDGEPSTPGIENLDCCSNSGYCACCNYGCCTQCMTSDTCRTIAVPGSGIGNVVSESFKIMIKTSGHPWVTVPYILVGGLSSLIRDTNLHGQRYHDEIGVNIGDTRYGYCVQMATCDWGQCALDYVDMPTCLAEVQPLFAGSLECMTVFTLGGLAGVSLGLNPATLGLSLLGSCVAYGKVKISEEFDRPSMQHSLRVEERRRAHGPMAHKIDVATSTFFKAATTVITAPAAFAMQCLPPEVSIAASLIASGITDGVTMGWGGVHEENTQKSLHNTAKGLSCCFGHGCSHCVDEKIVNNAPYVASALAVSGMVPSHITELKKAQEYTVDNQRIGLNKHMEKTYTPAERAQYVLPFTSIARERLHKQLAAPFCPTTASSALANSLIAHDHLAEAPPSLVIAPPPSPVVVTPDDIRSPTAEDLPLERLASPPPMVVVEQTSQHRFFPAHQEQKAAPAKQTTSCLSGLFSWFGRSATQTVPTSTSDTNATNVVQAQPHPANFTS
jgi:hypothetical protein